MIVEVGPGLGQCCLWRSGITAYHLDCDYCITLLTVVVKLDDDPASEQEYHPTAMECAGPSRCH